LEKTSKIIKSNRHPNTPMPAKPCPEVPHPHGFWTPPGMGTPPLPWAAWSNVWPKPGFGSSYRPRSGLAAQLIAFVEFCSTIPTNQDLHKLQESRVRAALSIAALLTKYHFTQIHFPHITRTEPHRSQRLSWTPGWLLSPTPPEPGLLEGIPPADPPAPANPSPQTAAKPAANAAPFRYNLP